MNEAICVLLDRVHVPQDFLGYEYLHYALKLRLAEPDCQLTKWLYPSVAKASGTNWKSVDRNIRSAIKAGWERGGQAAMEELTGYVLEKKPSNGAFLRILAGALNGNP